MPYTPHRSIWKQSRPWLGRNRVQRAYGHRTGQMPSSIYDRPIHGLYDTLHPDAGVFKVEKQAIACVKALLRQLTTRTGGVGVAIDGPSYLSEVYGAKLRIAKKKGRKVSVLPILQLVSYFSTKGISVHVYLPSEAKGAKGYLQETHLLDALGDVIQWMELPIGAFRWSKPRRAFYYDAVLLQAATQSGRYIISNDLLRDHLRVLLTATTLPLAERRRRCLTIASHAISIKSFSKQPRGSAEISVSDFSFEFPGGADDLLRQALPIEMVTDAAVQFGLHLMPDWFYTPEPDSTLTPTDDFVRDLIGYDFPSVSKAALDADFGHINVYQGVVLPPQLPHQASQFAQLVVFVPRQGIFIRPAIYPRTTLTVGEGVQVWVRDEKILYFRRWPAPECSIKSALPTDFQLECSAQIDEKGIVTAPDLPGFSASTTQPTAIVKIQVKYGSDASWELIKIDGAFHVKQSAVPSHSAQELLASKENLPLSSAFSSFLARTLIVTGFPVACSRRDVEVLFSIRDGCFMWLSPTSQMAIVSVSTAGEAMDLCHKGVNIGAHRLHLEVANLVQGDFGEAIRDSLRFAWLKTVSNRPEESGMPKSPDLEDGEVEHFSSIAEGELESVSPELSADLAPPPFGPANTPPIRSSLPEGRDDSQPNAEELRDRVLVVKGLPFHYSDRAFESYFAPCLSYKMWEERDSSSRFALAYYASPAAMEAMVAVRHLSVIEGCALRVYPAGSCGLHPTQLDWLRDNSPGRDGEMGSTDIASTENAPASSNLSMRLSLPPTGSVQRETVESESGPASLKTADSIWGASITTAIETRLKAVRGEGSQNDGMEEPPEISRGIVGPSNDIESATTNDNQENIPDELSNANNSGEGLKEGKVTEGATAPSGSRGVLTLSQAGAEGESAIKQGPLTQSPSPASSDIPSHLLAKDPARWTAVDVVELALSMECDEEVVTIFQQNGIRGTTLAWLIDQSSWKKEFTQLFPRLGPRSEAEMLLQRFKVLLHASRAPQFKKEESNGENNENDCDVICLD